MILHEQSTISRTSQHSLRNSTLSVAHFLIFCCVSGKDLIDKPFQATKKAFPNRGRTRYDSVHACLIRWEEDDLFVEPELRRLNNVFQDYGFSTNIWEIPSRNSHLDLMMKTGQFLQSFDSDKNLFIVYYGGHGRIDSERQAEWTCKRDPSYAKVRWSAIQAAFAEAMSDTLILLDTCAAASATTRSQHGSMEVIMASGFEAKAPPPGEHSFTNALVDVLESWVRRPSFSASCLHAEILTELKMKPRKKGREGTKLEWCVTPIHLNCTQTSTALGIELCRRNILPRGHVSAESEPSDNSNPSTDAMSLDFICSDNNSPSPLSALSPTGKYETPHVLISVAIEEDQPDLDVKKTAQWLESIPFLAKWTKVECAFPSYSTLLVLSLPVVIWNMLPDHPACSFIGYVTAPNLIATSPPSLEDEICDGKMRRGGVKSEPKLEDEGLPMRSEISQPISHQTCIDEIKDLDPTSENDSKDNVWLSTVSLTFSKVRKKQLHTAKDLCNRKTLFGRHLRTFGSSRSCMNATFIPQRIQLATCLLFSLSGSQMEYKFRLAERNNTSL